MSHLDELVMSLTPEEAAYLRSALDATEAPDINDEGEEMIPLSPEDEE